MPQIFTNFIIQKFWLLLFILNIIYIKKKKNCVKISKFVFFSFFLLLAKVNLDVFSFFY